MKILLSSHAFYPQIGGIESISEALAGEFVRLGHEVRIVTQSAGEDKPEWPYEVLRRPSAGGLTLAVRWCDVFFHNNISLQTAWPLLAVPKPWVVAHQTWIARMDRTLNWQDHLKRLLLRRATNVAISGEIARSLPVKSAVIPNPYREDLFFQMPEVARDRDLVFLGRLVSDKGADLLLQALRQLKDEGLALGLTLIGSGPEGEPLRAQARALGLEKQIDFAGPKTGVELARMLNAHRVMVVPSRWAEPFGVVALEGIACGCAVVGSAAGGLSDAMGPCGVTFPNGDAGALAAAIRGLWEDPGRREALLGAAPDHLARHTSQAVAAAYLEIFKRLVS